MTSDQLFSRMLTFILRPDHEGGYSNDPQDPGKETMRGITAAVARKWGYLGPMRDLSMELTEKIYRKDYFDACRCAELPAPLAVLVFDAAVNQGPGAAGECLQEAANSMGLSLKVDGAIGPKTVAGVNSINPVRIAEFVDELAARRGYRYALLDAIDDRFGLGWNRRLMRCHRLAIELTRAA